MKKYLLIISFFCLTSSLCAELLQFKIGDSASYCIHQKVEAEIEIFGETTFCQSDAHFDLGILITSESPLEVEVKLRKVSIKEYQKDDVEQTFTYNSSTPGINKLINYPLQYKLENEFSFEETTGFLDYVNLNFLDKMELVSNIESTLNLILLQAFALSGESLELAQSYPTSCYQVFEWDDEKLDMDEMSLTESSNYLITQIDANKASASLSGFAVLDGFDHTLTGKLNIEGNVTWDLKNPLIQKRSLNASVEEELVGLLPVNIKMAIRQTLNYK